MKFRDKIEDGIYKISLLDLYNFVYGQNHTYLQAFRDLYLELFVQNEDEISDEYPTPDIDIIYGIQFLNDKDNFKIIDYYISLPAIFYLLFNWLEFTRNNRLPLISSRIWSAIYYFTENKKYFNLENADNQ